MSAWGWVDRADFALGAESVLDRWPHLRQWFAALDARPAVQRARRIGHGLSFKKEFDQEAMRAMFPQNFPPAH